MINDLKPYHLYKIHARNSSFGIYTPKDYGFLIRRLKFYDIYLFTEYHYDTGMPYGTVKPQKELEKTPFAAEDLKYDRYNGHLIHDEIINYLETKAKEYDNE